MPNGIAHNSIEHIQIGDAFLLAFAITFFIGLFVVSGILAFVRFFCGRSFSAQDFFARANFPFISFAFLIIFSNFLFASHLQQLQNNCIKEFLLANSEHQNKQNLNGNNSSKKSLHKKLSQNTLLPKASGQIVTIPKYRLPGMLEFEIQLADGRRLLAKLVKLPWEEQEPTLDQLVYFEGELTTIFQEYCKLPELYSYESYLLLRNISGTVLITKLSTIQDGSQPETLHLDYIPPETLLIPPKKTTQNLARKLYFEFDNNLNLQDDSNSKEYQRYFPLIISSILGADEFLSRDIKELFKEFGLTHLLVVSGFQFSLIFVIVNKVFKKIFQSILILVRYSLVEIIAFAFSTFFILLYSAAVGFNITTVRALIFIAVLCLSQIIFTKSSFFRTILVGILLIQVAFPGAVFDVSFDLSFLAIAGIFTAKYCSESLNLTRNIFTRTVSFILYNFFPWLFTAPVTYLLFDNFTLKALFANLILGSILNLSLVCFGALSLVLVGLFGLSNPLSSSVLSVNLWVLEKIIWVLECF